MKVHVLQIGEVLVSPAVPDRDSKKWSKAYTGLFQSRKQRLKLPVKVFLVEVNGRKILVDTGWSQACLEHPIKHLGFGLWFSSEPVLSPQQTILAQLNNLKISLSEIDALIMTHLDCDHASGLRDVKEIAQIYCSEAELLQTKKHDIRYRDSFWQDVDLKPLEMQVDAQAPFEKSVDLFDDGSVKIVLTPGHSAGSVAVLFYEQGKYVACIGDDSYNRASYENQKLPGPLFSKNDMLKTLNWVKQLSKDPNCLALYMAHDPEVLAQTYQFDLN